MIGQINKPLVRSSDSGDINRKVGVQQADSQGQETVFYASRKGPGEDGADEMLVVAEELTPSGGPSFPVREPGYRVGSPQPGVVLPHGVAGAQYTRQFSKLPGQSMCVLQLL